MVDVGLVLKQVQALNLQDIQVGTS